MLLHALNDVTVQLAIKTFGIGARVLTNFREEQRIESGTLRAVCTTPGFRQKRFIVFRKRHRLEAEVYVLLNPRLQSARGYEAPFRVARGKIAVKAMGQRLFLYFGRKLCNQQRMLDTDMPSGEGVRCGL